MCSKCSFIRQTSQDPLTPVHNQTQLRSSGSDSVPKPFSELLHSLSIHNMSTSLSYLPKQSHFSSFPECVLTLFCSIGTDRHSFELLFHPQLFMKPQVKSSSRNLSQLVMALTCLVLSTALYVCECALNNGLVISCLTRNKPVNFQQDHL